MTTGSDFLLNPFARLKSSSSDNSLISLENPTKDRTRALSCILGNLLARYNQTNGASCNIRYSSHKSSWVTIERSLLSRTAFVAVMEELVAAGWITTTKGFKMRSGKCLLSFFTPTEKLMGLLSAISRLNVEAILPAEPLHATEIGDAKLNLAEVRMSAIDEAKEKKAAAPILTTPRELATQLHDFNSLLLKHEWQVKSPTALSELDFKSSGEGCYSIKPHALIYKRVFHFSEKKNAGWDIGGRYYNNAISQMPNTKEYQVRTSMTIDGDESVELDLKCLHINLLRHELGLDVYQGDAYAVGLGCDNDPLARAIVKAVALVALNCKSKKALLLAVREQIESAASDPKHRLFGAKEFIIEHPAYNPANVFEALKRTHPELEGAWCSAPWKRLTRLDSEILFQTIKGLLKDSIPAFLVHDSLIVKRVDAEKVRGHLVWAYSYLTGYMPRIEYK